MRRQHQRVGRQRRSNAASECEEARQRIAVGLDGHTLTLVLILGSSMSPEISTSALGAVERRVLGRMTVAGE